MTDSNTNCYVSYLFFSTRDILVTTFRQLKLNSVSSYHHTVIGNLGLFINRPTPRKFCLPKGFSGRFVWQGLILSEIEDRNIHSKFQYHFCNQNGNNIQFSSLNEEKNWHTVMQIAVKSNSIGLRYPTTERWDLTS